MTEGEYLAMNAEAFNPRFLRMVERTKANKNKKRADKNEVVQAFYKR